MRQLPLNIATLYADLQQSVDRDDAVPGSISKKTVGGRQYLYAVERVGASRLQRYLGPSDTPEAQVKAKAVRRAAALARERRATVSLLKGARLPAPTLLVGRILEVLARARIFERGMTLVGTNAYQTYAGYLGVHLPAATLMTNDVDLSAAEFVAGAGQEDLETILKRADPTFRPRWHRDDDLPRDFVNEKGFAVDIITRYGRGRRSPVKIEALKVSAEALTFQEYAAESAIEVIALYNAGVLVRVPDPVRYAVHKLLVAQRRAPEASAKRRKDLAQANELLDVLGEVAQDQLIEELAGVRKRGSSWRAAINASLTELRRTADGVRRLERE